MLIVGELINTSRKSIKAAVDAEDAAYIQQIARGQMEAGADYVDINCGTKVYNEPETMQWLVETVQAAVSVPLCIDTPNPKAMELGLSLVQNGQPMINSITAEKERFQTILPLVLKHKAKVVALCMDDSGMPETANDRKGIVRRLVADLTKSGVPEDDIYLDPLVKPVSTSDGAGLEVLETIAFIRAEFPGVQYHLRLEQHLLRPPQPAGAQQAVHGSDHDCRHGCLYPGSSGQNHHGVCPCLPGFVGQGPVLRAVPGCLPPGVVCVNLRQ